MAESEQTTKSSEFFVEVSPNSPLSFSTLRKYKEVTFWERAEIPDIPFFDGDLQIVLKSTDRVDNLASTFYKDPDLFWALAHANGIRLPPLQMNGGYAFRVPPPTALSKVFGKAK